jgi:hypothetical protein
LERLANIVKRNEAQLQQLTKSYSPNLVHVCYLPYTSVSLQPERQIGL